MHGRVDAHAIALETFVNAAQGIEIAFRGLEFDARPAQANLLKEEHFIVAGGRWDAVCGLDVVRIVCIDRRLARLLGRIGGRELSQCAGSADRERRLEKSPSILGGSVHRSGIVLHWTLLVGGVKLLLAETTFRTRPDMRSCMAARHDPNAMALRLPCGRSA